MPRSHGRLGWGIQDTDLDEKVKVSADDTTPNFLLPKLTAGVGITLTEQNPGDNENILISAPGSTTDELVSVSGADTTPGFLDTKITVGAGLSKAITSPGGDERLNLVNTFSAAELTPLIPFQQIWFPASIMALESSQEPIFQNIQIGSLAKNYDVITFPPSVLTGVSWAYTFKSGELDAAAPLFKMKAIWFQSGDVADPTDDVLFDFYIRNVLLGASLNSAFTGGTIETSPTAAQWVLTSGNGDIEDGIEVIPTGGTISAVNTNTLEFQIERHGEMVGDDYDDNAHLLGVMLQYATDFSNIAVWPT